MDSYERTYTIDEAINMYDSDPLNRTSIYNIIVEYFGDIVMTKKSINNEYSVYYSNIGCLLCLDNRYLVAITQNDDFPINYSCKLSELSWVSFQTRIFDKIGFRLKQQQIKQLKVSRLLLSKIEKVDETKTKSVYMSHDVPLKIELLKENEIDKHSETGTIKIALDTYACVLSFIL